MKKYKVIKQLGNWEFGQCFDSSEEFTHFLRLDNMVSAGIIEELKPRGRFKPEVGEEYWHISLFGSTQTARWAGQQHERWHYTTNNVFRTEVEALAHKKYLEAVHTVSEYIREENGDWVADWSDESAKKYYIFEQKVQKYFICYWYAHHIPTVLPYMRSEKLAKSVVEKFPEELKVIFGKV